MNTREPNATVVLHPADAADRRLCDGDRAVLANETGRLTMRVRVADIVPRGVALTHEGRWPKQGPDQMNVNWLNPGHKADMDESTCVHGVEVTGVPIRDDVREAYSDLTLRRPREDEEEEFLRAHRDTSPEVPSFLHYYEDGMPFRRYLEVLAEQEQGVSLPANHVPSTFLFAFVGTRIVGRASIRHSLNDFLHRVGGHIGYVVVPEFRRRGYATEILRQSLLIAREKCGVHRILVTCDDDNIGSIRTIEKNGGILENVVDGPDLDKPKRRYWIHPR